MKTTLAAGSAAAFRSSTSRRASRGKRVGLLAVADGLTRPGLRAAAVRVRRLLGRPAAGSSVGGNPGESRDQSGSTSQVLVGGPDLRFYHRAGCVMAADREWSAASSSEHNRAGRSPCGMCRP